MFEEERPVENAKGGVLVGIRESFLPAIIRIGTYLCGFSL